VACGFMCLWQLHTDATALVCTLTRAGSGRRSMSNALGYTCWYPCGTNTERPPLVPPGTAFSQTYKKSRSRKAESEVENQKFPCRPELVLPRKTNALALEIWCLPFGEGW